MRTIQSCGFTFWWEKISSKDSCPGACLHETASSITYSLLSKTFLFRGTWTHADYSILLDDVSIGKNIIEGLPPWCVPSKQRLFYWKLADGTQGAFCFSKNFYRTSRFRYRRIIPALDHDFTKQLLFCFTTCRWHARTLLLFFKCFSGQACFENRHIIFALW